MYHSLKCYSTELTSPQNTFRTPKQTRATGAGQIQGGEGSSGQGTVRHTGTTLLSQTVASTPRRHREEGKKRMVWLLETKQPQEQRSTAR